MGLHHSFGDKLNERPHVNGILRWRRGDYKGKFCTGKISTLVARAPLLVWIPAPSTHSAMLRAGSAQDRSCEGLQGDALNVSD